MAEHSNSLLPRKPVAYRGVVFLIMGASLVGALSVAVAGLAVANPVVLDAAGALCLSTGLLGGVAGALSRRARVAIAAPATESDVPPDEDPHNAQESWKQWPYGLWRRLLSARGMTAVATAFIVTWLLSVPRPVNSNEWVAVAAAGWALGAACLVATVASYFAGTAPEEFPEGPGLARGARLLAWILGAAAIAVGLAWFGYSSAVRSLHFAILALDAIVCLELVISEAPQGVPSFPVDLGIFIALGSRANPLASLGDAARRQLGIDLRSTWAIAVVRRSAEPLIVTLLVIGWLSTSATIVGVQDEGLVEHFGVPRAGPPLASGLHLHWPWPIDRVVRVPVHRVQQIAVGHEGEEEAGPENVLWARQHGEGEYTLLLGDGRELIAVDAAVQFRIADAKAWQYHVQNPVDALRAIAYRAVMKATVGRTLAEVLSENVQNLTAQMRTTVQADADEIGLGIRVLGFTVGGMHPPVKVAIDYQSVVSAAVRKVTAEIDAQAYENSVLPAAESAVTKMTNEAMANAAEARGRATGEAWAFSALEAEYGAAPAEYRFRRRLEVLESVLGDRHYTVIDTRIQRDGGELWLMK